MKVGGDQVDEIYLLGDTEVTSLELLGKTKVRLHHVIEQLDGRAIWDEDQNLMVATNTLEYIRGKFHGEISEADEVCSFSENDEV